jgi:hypothetical protein
MKKENRQFIGFCTISAACWFLLLVSFSAVHYSKSSPENASWGDYSPFDYLYLMLSISAIWAALVGVLIVENRLPFPSLSKKAHLPTAQVTNKNG